MSYLFYQKASYSRAKKECFTVELGIMSAVHTAVTVYLQGDLEVTLEYSSQYECQEFNYILNVLMVCGHVSGY